MPRVYMTRAQCHALGHHCAVLSEDRNPPHPGEDPTEDISENYIEITDGGSLGVNGAYLHRDGEWSSYEEVIHAD